MQPKLHAKVYCLPDRVIIGSSNVSTNGLGFEGPSMSNNIEASLFTMDKGAISDTILWFEKMWSQAEPVNAATADEAMPFWKDAQRKRIPPNEGLLLAAVKANLTSKKFDDIFVALYPKGDASMEAKERYEGVKSRIFKQAELEQIGDQLPFYEDYEGNFDFKSGTAILDFYYDSKVKPAIFNEMWQIRDGNPYVPLKIKGHGKARLVMCDLCYQYKGLRLTKKDVSKIAKMLFIYSKKNNVWQDWAKQENYGFTVWIKLSELLRSEQ